MSYQRPEEQTDYQQAKLSFGISAGALVRALCVLAAICSLTFANIATPVSAKSAVALLPAKEVHVSAQLIADTSAIEPSKPFTLGVAL